MATRTSTACGRCREQKLRCSRERPSCERCLRLRAVCQFPEPPNHKALAGLRAQSKKRKADDCDQQSPASSSHCEPLAPNSSSLSCHPSRSDAAVDDGTCAKPELHLSLQVRSLLQEVYMTCMFNASLIFQRSSFSRKLSEGRFPGHVVLAVYASATIFMPATSAIAKRKANLLQPLGDLSALGRQWAIRAGKEVLQDIDQPTIESVQTCEILALYWFSSGESRRNIMFSGIAYKAATTLVLDLKETAPPPNEKATSSSNFGRLDSETSRRCFWAVWLTQCINSDHHLVGTACDSRVMNLPLPLGDEQVNQNAEQSVITLATILKPPFKPPASAPANSSITAELMVLVLNWTKIRDLIQATNCNSARNRLADLLELEGQLSSWSARLFESFRYSKRNLYEQLVVNQQPLYVLVHALYHQCRLVLHSWLVPQFSGLHLDERIPPEATGLSARIALRSAHGISELGADVLALDWDLSQLAPFVGYCMYVSASIQITLLPSTDIALVALARANLVSNLRLLKAMKLYWTHLERLWTRINLLYGTQMSRRRVSSSEAEATDSPLHPSELERLAGETRDTGKLSEPLADSVLEYTLRRLNPDAKVDSRAVEELERSLRPDDLFQLMKDDSIFPWQASSGQMTMGSGGQSSLASLNQGLHGGATIIPGSGRWERTETAPMAPLQTNYDWWQLNLDSIQQPILPFDEFVLNF